MLGERNFGKHFLLLLFSILLLSAPLKAQANRHNHIMVGISYFNVLRKENNALEGRIEYRSEIPVIKLKPFAGMTLTSAGTFYGMGGLYYDFSLGSNFLITPSFAAGYFEKGSGFDLAYGLEFRSQIEILYVLKDDIRMGISFNHISNANLGKSNPGVESFAFLYSIPIK
jgi:lipid A 3-O-deacylase